MAAEAGTSGDSYLHALLREVRTAPGEDDEGSYYALTLTATDDGVIEVGALTHFVGWPAGGGPDAGIELRAASLVHPRRMTDAWDVVGQQWIVVRRPAHLAILAGLGGNALVLASLAETVYPELAEPRESAHDGPAGFLDYRPGAREATHRAPTPKQRQRILKRDHYRCVLCGARPADDPHVRLHVHHIRMFSRGGLTIDENLITLCHTCHDGLVPHEDLALYRIGGHYQRRLDSHAPNEFVRRVEAYRRRVGDLDGSTKSTRRQQQRG